MTASGSSRARTAARRARSPASSPEAGKVIVDGLNVAKKHQRATRATMQGGIIDKEMPIPVSNVAVLAGDGKPTTVGYRFDDKGNKVRIARRTGEDI